MNSYTATGRLTRDPELRQLTSGTSVCQMRVAIDRMGRNGQTGYINVASFGKAGEAAAEYLSKGSPVAVSGRLEYQEWKAQDGSARSGYTVIGHVEFLGRPQNADAEDPDSPPDTPEVTDEDPLDS